MEMTAAIQYILTTGKIIRLSGLQKKSRMTILGLAGVLFCENEQAKWIDKMDYRMFRRKYLLGCLGKLGEVSKQLVGNRVTARL